MRMNTLTWAENSNFSMQDKMFIVYSTLLLCSPIAKPIPTAFPPLSTFVISPAPASQSISSTDHTSMPTYPAKYLFLVACKRRKNKF